MVQSISSGIKERFKNMENNNTLTTATFLNPRFKHLVFMETDQQPGSSTRVDRTRFNIQNLLVRKQFQLDRYQSSGPSRSTENTSEAPVTTEQNKLSI